MGQRTEENDRKNEKARAIILKDLALMIEEKRRLQALKKETEKLD